jgi:hypothetical protein
MTVTLPFTTVMIDPGTQTGTFRDRLGDVGSTRYYLFHDTRESFAALVPDHRALCGWRVRQGGPVALWDAAEAAILAWRAAGGPDVTAFTVRIEPGRHTYEMHGRPEARWEHPVA